MNDDRDKVAMMIDRCNNVGVDTIDAGNLMAMAMEMTEQGKLDAEGMEWGDAETMIEMIGRIGTQAEDDDLAQLLGLGAERIADRRDAHGNKLSVKGQTMAAYDPRCMKGMAIGYATSNRGACHLRGYTPAAEILGIPQKVDPHDPEGKGELCATFQDMHAISDSFDICKFNAFAEGVEEYVLQYNGMTGRDVTEDELMEAGERIYNLERYYNNLCGFDGADDTLPGRFVEGHESAMPGQGGSEGDLAELDQLKAEYYETRGWVDGVVPDEKLAELGIEVGPGTGVSTGGSGATADD
jgi:aldehyde:ferredoxin oxidoreductase